MLDELEKANAAPLPGTVHQEDSSSASTQPPTKKAALLALYREHPDYGKRNVAARAAAELAPQAHSQLMRWWVWPLPPDGPLEFICQWPVYGIGETRGRCRCAADLRRRR